MTIYNLDLQKMFMVTRSLGAYVLIECLIFSFQLVKHIYNENLFLTLSPHQQELSLFDNGYLDDFPNFSHKEAEPIPLKSYVQSAFEKVPCCHTIPRFNRCLSGCT